MEDIVKQKLIDLCDFALKNDVDYVYVIEDIKSALEGNANSVLTCDLEDYLD